MEQGELLELRDQTNLLGDLQNRLEFLIIGTDLRDFNDQSFMGLQSVLENIKKDIGAVDDKLTNFCSKALKGGEHA